MELPLVAFIFGVTAIVFFMLLLAVFSILKKSEYGIVGACVLEVRGFLIKLPFFLFLFCFSFVLFSTYL